MTVTGLLDRVRANGFTVRVVRGVPECLPLEDGARLPDDVLTDLKANREAVIAFLSEFNPLLSAPEKCRVCSRQVDDEDRDVLATNFYLCDLGGSRGNRDHPATPRCPYRRDET